MKLFYLLWLLILSPLMCLGQDLTPFKKDRLWGFKNGEKEVVISPKYNGVTEFFGEYTCVNIGGKGKESNPIGGKWGVIDKKGNEIVPPIYDYVDLCSDGVVAVNNGCVVDDNGIIRGGLWGYVDLSTSEYLIEPSYQQVAPFINGVAWVQKGGNLERKIRTFMNEKDNSRLFYPTQSFSISDLFTTYSSEGEWYLINKSGEIISSQYYLKVGDFDEGLCWVSKNELYGFINTAGVEIVQPIYSAVQGVIDFWDLSVKYTIEGKVVRWIKDKNGMIAWVSSDGTMITPFSESSGKYSIKQVIPENIWDF